MDLSGSIQGAGEIGGLLAVAQGSATYYPTHDGNGNVNENAKRLDCTAQARIAPRQSEASQYLDDSGTVVAHCEYDAFGNTTSSDGAKTSTFLKP